MRKKKGVPGAKRKKVMEWTDKFWKRIMKYSKDDSHLGWMAISRLQHLHIQLKLQKSKEKDASLISDDRSNQSPGT